MKNPGSLSSIVSSGKYKGRSVASVYSGEPRELVRLFLELIDKSFALIFSKDFYSVPDEPDEINFYAIAGGWAGDEKKVSHHTVGWVVWALRDGGSCEYNISPTKIRILIKDKKGELNKYASECACEIAREFLARCFARVEDEYIGDLRPASISLPQEKSLEEKIQLAEGNPKCIYRHLRKTDGFYLTDSKESLRELNDLPVFSLGSLTVKLGKMKEDYSFKLRFLLGSDFEKADEYTIKKNYEKYSAYLNKQEESTQEYYSENGNDDDEYHDSDDDEDNIMRGLANGDGDSFGF
ncbi:hypothetical protein [Hymenobacter sp. BRD67]|uniref:hypothetical protein n=1 Tax=Hymenobacter sp. BRD67 TaxID=2675877 RepID=UPI00156717D9|nr:hypothetical protein [Hymenobacter sp. BRD67]QKG51688.1 hypothetical protein GKZ67_02620 [Hymenobacter sp. BRD67]